MCPTKCNRGRTVTVNCIWLRSIRCRATGRSTGTRIPCTGLGTLLRLMLGLMKLRLCRCRNGRSWWWTSGRRTRLVVLVTPFRCRLKLLVKQLWLKARRLRLSVLSLMSLAITRTILNPPRLTHFSSRLTLNGCVKVPSWHLRIYCVMASLRRRVSLYFRVLNGRRMRCVIW